MADGLNGPTNEEARELLEIRLEEARAQHAEDMEKLGREMNEVVAQRDAARATLSTRARAASSLHFQAMELLGGSTDNDLRTAARRVVAERDEAIARAEKAEAALEAARASATLVTMVGDIGVRNSGDATRLEAILAERDAAIARAEKAEAEVDDFAGLVRELNPRAEKAESDSAALADLYNKSSDRADALAAELAAIRAATGEEPSDVELGDAYIAAYNAAGLSSPFRAAYRALYNLGRSAALGEVARLREAARADRVRLFAALDTAGWEGDDAAFVSRLASERDAAIARAERPACLVARAVALGCDVEVWREGYEPQCTWRVTVESTTPGMDVDDFVKSTHDLTAADVPATLARLLDEVEASRKVVTR